MDAEATDAEEVPKSSKGAMKIITPEVLQERAITAARAAYEDWQVRARVSPLKFHAWV